MPGLDEIKQHRAKVAQLGTLLQEFSTDDAAADPGCREKIREIVQILLEVHGAALSVVMDELENAGGPGHAVRDALAQHELVANLLLLHGLHPLDFQTRVMQGLDKARPTLHAHGGDVELLGLDDGIIRLRLQGSCHGCPSSSVTLKHAIEEALYEKAPDLVAIEVEGVEEAPVESHPHVHPGLVQLTARGTALSA